MYRRGQSTILSAVVFVLLVGLLAGCGGGGQSGNGSQDGGAPSPQKKEGKQGARVANRGGPQLKIAVGTIVATDPESKPNGKIVLRPTAQVQGGERIIFKLAKNAKITLEDKEAELAEIKKGQQAQIHYTQVKVGGQDTEKTRTVNSARVVQAFSEGGGNGGG